MPVANQIESRKEVNRILRKSLTGKKSGRQKKSDVAKVVAESIFLRWRVGPFGWRLKHLCWYLDVHLKDAKQSTRYEHWLAIRCVLERTENAHIVALLAKRINSDYLRP
jgi:hypothetical protein